MPSSSALSFSDPLDYQSAIRAADVSVYPTAKGAFHAELVQINLHRLWMQRFEQKLPQIYQSKVKPGRTVIGFLTADQLALQYCGATVSPHEIVICGQEVMHQRSSGDCQFGAMSLARDDFVAACKVIAGHEIMEMPNSRVIRPSNEPMSRLVRLHGLVGNLARGAADTLALPEVAWALEQHLIHLMVRCLIDSTQSEAPKAFGSHKRIVTRFETYLEANPLRPLYLTEICAAISVSERTLRVVCEEHLGMGPIRYLTLRRMHLVRHALLRADCLSTSVTRVVTGHGFWEMGHFSVAYRALFGEMPSVTLRRPPPDLPMISTRPSSLATDELG